MKCGYKNGKYYISASVIGTYLYNKKAGVRKYFGVQKDDNPVSTSKGITLHKKFGFNDRGVKEFYCRELVLSDNTVVVLYGIPDEVEDDAVIEFKTVGYYVGVKKFKAGVGQLLTYMFIFDKKKGVLLFYNRRLNKIVMSVILFRNDDFVKKVVEDLLHDITIYW